MPKVPALVLTPAARDLAIQRMLEHYALNHLETADFERRVERVENATTTAQLEEAFAGLPPLDDRSLQKQERSGQLTTTVKALLASTTHRGAWSVPSRLVVKATLGSVELDLTEARISGDVDIDIRATLGGVRVVVPEGLAVEAQGQAVLGSFDGLAQGASTRRDKRRVRIVGRALLGSVEIIVRPARRGLLDTVKGFLEGR